MKVTAVFYLVQKLRIRDAIRPISLRVHGEVFKKIHNLEFSSDYHCIFYVCVRVR